MQTSRSTRTLQKSFKPSIAMLMLIRFTLCRIQYLVTDGENFASAIDGIFADNEGNIYLVDYKTTATPGYDNVFATAIHLRENRSKSRDPDWCKVKEDFLHVVQERTEQVPAATERVVLIITIDNLINAYLADDAEYQYKVEVPEQFSALEQEYRLITARMDALKIKQDDLKEQMMKMMEANKQKSIKTNIGSYSYVAATTKKTFDTKLFKDTEPEHYEYYLKETTTKPSIRIKLN